MVPATDREYGTGCMATSPSHRPARRILPLLLASVVLGGGALMLGPRIAGAPVPSPQTEPSAIALASMSPAPTARSDASPAPSASPARSSAPSAPSASAAAASDLPSPDVSAPPPRPAASSAAPSLGPSASAPPTIAPEPPGRPERLSATLAKRLTLDQQLDRLRWRTGVPGVSAAIVFPDGTIWLGQSGLADVEDAVPVGPDTAFAIASLTKTFTAAIILDLVDDDLIDLDARVLGYLPDIDVEMDERTTVRQLLDHTSGLRDYFFDPRIDRALLAKTDATWTAERSLGYVGKPYFRAGRGWHYSNTNYLVLGMLAEAVSGETLADLYRTRIFVPLGLRDTVYQPAGPAAGPTAHGYRFATTGRSARPIDLSDGTAMVPFTSVVTAAAAAGGMASSADDVARWARALYGGQALSPEALGAMLGGIERTDRLEPRIPYGLGVQAVELDGRLTYGHSGRLLGFRSLMRHLPAEGITIVVLTNQSRTDPTGIARELLRTALRPIERCSCTGRD
jgi:D-alanyl-D-alanine carboxypeptidase